MSADTYWAFFLCSVFFFEMLPANFVIYMRELSSLTFSVRVVVLSHRDGTSKSRARAETGSNKEDPELTAQLHRTLADFEANLAGDLQWPASIISKPRLDW